MLRLQKQRTTQGLKRKRKRLSVLMGTPPPEPTAEAPVIGARDRRINTKKGKSALRISHKGCNFHWPGAGLNIT